MPPAITALRCSARSRASPHATESRSPTWTAAVSVIRASKPTSTRFATRENPALGKPPRPSRVAAIYPRRFEMVIAIDGPAGAGKSTVARALAERLGFTYLDTGAMYRCVALLAVRLGAELDDPEAIGAVAAATAIDFDADRVLLAGEDVTAPIRDSEVSQAASRIAVHPQVRRALVDLQRERVREGGWVAEGRDIGTVVAPDSPLKVFLDASDEERARRRAAETGEDPAEVLAAQQIRDERDSTRSEGALAAAPDSIRLDTTGLGVADVVERVAELAAERGLTTEAGR